MSSIAPDFSQGIKNLNKKEVVDMSSIAPDFSQGIKNR